MDHLFTKCLEEQKEKAWKQQGEESDPTLQIFHSAQLTVNRDWTPNDPEAAAQVSTASTFKLHNTQGCSGTQRYQQRDWNENEQNNAACIMLSISKHLLYYTCLYGIVTNPKLYVQVFALVLSQ